MELPLALALVLLHHTGDSLKCGKYFYIILYYNHNDFVCFLKKKKIVNFIKYGSSV